MPTKPGENLYRSEALASQLRRGREPGRLLELSPRWAPWTFRLLLATFAAGLAFSLVASIDEYATGSFVLRTEGRVDVTAPLAGTVSGVEVEAGQAVRRGQLLARLYSAQEAAELERVRREFELGLLHRLRFPTDPGSEHSLRALRAQRALAESRLEHRSLRAPLDGRVSDVRVAPGQSLRPGELVVAVTGPRQEMSVIVILPGHFRPLIRPGLPLRLQLEGYRHADQRLDVERVSEEVIGAAEARRVLGPGAGDALPSGGPVIFAHARLPAATFESGGHEYRFHEGMRGVAEVRVRSETLLASLFPALRGLSP
ncbi:MAG: HlyD family efflux transporter periplasmic adaptor subunit [Holophagales bacterium]|nr:HlyD family efflux transporter periplasmic adaptor subunit [Holophagales bacterium]